MTAPNRNTLWARVFVDELARAGVRHATLAPGSRSTPLVLALARHDDVTVTVHLDERSAAFHALGIGKATGTPAAVVTTSGTAAANLHPAVVEAERASTPLVMLTADRPPELKGTDANQTIDQTKLYGDAVNAFHDLGTPTMTPRALAHLRTTADRVVAQALGRPAGPVHVNAPFAKPLEPTPVEDDVPADLARTAKRAIEGRPDGAPFTTIAPRRHPPDPADVTALAGALAETERPVILAGPTPRPDALGPAALALAHATGAPLLTDPLSGARSTPGARDAALAGYDLFLGADALAERLAPDLVLRLGASPTSKAANRWLARHEQARQIVVDDGASFKDHLDTATTYLQADPARTARAIAETVDDTRGEKAWGAAWREAEARTRRVLDEHLTEQPCEATVLAHAARAVPPSGQLVVGNSMPIRDLDLAAAPRDASVRVIGNRGASGIDGLVSTALGAAEATGQPTLAVVGDLSLLHDTNGLHAVSDSEAPLVLLVVNNDGGGIFHKLPIAEHEGFTEYFATPHGRDLSHAAALHGLEHARLDGPEHVPGPLEDALADPRGQVLEVASDRADNHARHEALQAAVDAAVDTIEPR